MDPPRERCATNDVDRRRLSNATQSHVDFLNINVGDLG